MDFEDAVMLADHYATLAWEPTRTDVDLWGVPHPQVVEMRAAFAAMKEQRDAALAVLRLVEWEGRDMFGEVCPVCRYFPLDGNENGGHTPDCELARLLKKELE